jgi:hypothetical protein
MTNGSNGHSNGHAVRDDGAERDARPDKPCCNRLPTGDWCQGPATHSIETYCRHIDVSEPPAKTKAEFEAGKPAADARITATREQIFAGYTKGRSK